MKPLRLRTSLTLIYTAIVAVLVTSLAYGWRAAVVSQLDVDATAALEEKARALHAFLRFTGGVPRLAYRPDDVDEAAFIADATRFYQIYDAATGKLLTQSPGLEALGLHYTPAEVAEIRRHRAPYDVQTERGRLRLATTVLAPTPGAAYLVQVGELLDHVDRAVAAFDRLLFWRVLVGLVCAAIVGRWFAGRALAPLARLAAATRGIDIANLDARVAIRGTGDELDQVASAFNQTLQRLEGAVAEMRQFSTALAHELRTPLAILRGEAELVLRRAAGADDTVTVLLTSQIEEFDRLTRLINQVLTLARADTGEVALAAAPVDLSALCSAVVEQIEPVAHAGQLTLTGDVPSGVTVTGDAAWLERLLLVLLDNAIKYTPAGGTIALRLLIRPGAAVVEVSDTGMGVAPDAAAHLFERFYRGDAARATRAPGAGLGLALAKWIADRHRATIDVRSAPGAGSRFTVTLPVGPVTRRPGTTERASA